MKPALLLTRILRDPACASEVQDWTGLLCTARAESLLGSLAFRLAEAAVPPQVSFILDDARRDAAYARTQALWEAEMAQRALRDIPLILLKGTAYAAAGLPAGEGRSIGDLDILVARERLDEAEADLIAAGWEWVKEDPYDHLYYRKWMHELPPLIHRERDRMIDVHHTILPPTARPTPNAAALIDASVALPNGMRILCPEDMILHAVAHLLADGDLAGGLRNLWDIDRLIREFSAAPGFWTELETRSRGHGLLPAVSRAARLANDLYGTELPPEWRKRSPADALFKRRLLARDGWGRPTRAALRFAFYLRSHWLRMPPAMLARHLWTKARR